MIFFYKNNIKSGKMYKKIDRPGSLPYFARKRMSGGRQPRAPGFTPQGAGLPVTA
jgi:hypothetical protein